MNDQPKRRGRPPLDAADRKDGNLKFRTRGDLRQRLADEARKNCRSISEEVEHRLLASFQSEYLRQIVREEIAAACLAERIATTFMPNPTINVTGSVRRTVSPGEPVRFQIFGRDHLPS